MNHDHPQSFLTSEELDAMTFDVSHDITFKSEISSFFPLSRGDDVDWQDLNTGLGGRIRISSGLSHVLDSVAQFDHDYFVRAILREISSELRAATLSKSPIRFPIILDGVKGIAEEIWLVGNQFQEFNDPFERLEALKRAVEDPGFEWEGGIIRNELSLMFARDAMSGKLKDDQYREDVRRRKYSESHRLGWRLSEFHSTWALFQAFDRNTGKDLPIRMTSWIGEQRRYDLQLCDEETSLAFLFRSPVQLSFEEFERIRQKKWSAKNQFPSIDEATQAAEAWLDSDGGSGWLQKA